MSPTAVVTGGSGFIGAYLVKRLLKDDWNVVVVDSLVRGDLRRLDEVANDVEVVTADVRDEEALVEAFRGVDVVMHLAAINGTDNFYKQPELVLDVGIRGAIAVVNAARRAGVVDLVAASTAEVYQTPAVVPTPETIPLMLPNSLNPRYSYGGSKIATELIVFNYSLEHFRRVQVFRPHNVYGPDMGWKHVIPQFVQRAATGRAHATEGVATPFVVQGDGNETRAFCFVDDIVEGVLTMYRHGGHREIYHIGNDDEVCIRELAMRVAAIVGVQIKIETGAGAEGGTPRRCPDLTKMRALGYQPAVNLDTGLRRTVEWYLSHLDDAVVNSLL